MDVCIMMSAATMQATCPTETQDVQHNSANVRYHVQQEKKKLTVLILVIQLNFLLQQNIE